MAGDASRLAKVVITGWLMQQLMSKLDPPPPAPPPPPPARADATRLVPGDWFWPLPAITINGIRFAPVISDGWGWHRKDATGNPRLHAGADLVYQVRRVSENWGYRKPRELSNGGQFFAPPGLPVIAAQDGTVWRVSTGDKGMSVHLVHQKGLFATLYLHLSNVSVKRGARVGAGQSIGTWGYDPSNKSIRHVHFQCGPWDAAQKEFAWTDPKPLLARCKIGTTVQVKPPRVVS